MKPSEITHVDLVIIGGGINGAGIAAQAAQAGLSVVLFEKGDFASGTSSKSTKLIHGGIRYLEQGRLGLVFEALHERKRLLEMAPHLVHPVPFLLPCYREDERPPWMVKVGLWLYDLLAGPHNIARHKWFSPTQALQVAPALNPENLVGCGLYYDAQVNDARLVLENILVAEAKGAHCFNYCKVTGLNLASHQVRVLYQNNDSGEEGTVTASCLVNASGPWANQTAKLVSGDSPPLVRPTRGTHLVVPQVLSGHAVLVMSPKDRRVTFIIPWRGYSLVGTTDLDDAGNPDEVRPTQEEVAYLLNEASRIFPNVSWSQGQVLSAFAGLRPLAWAEEGHASSVSREDKILVKGNIVTIVGGKLTTYHSMARKAMEAILNLLGKKRLEDIPDRLPGTPDKPWNIFLNDETPRWIASYGLQQDQAEHLALLYGQRAGGILSLARENPRFLQRLCSSRPEISAQVAYAVQKEKALHLEDVLLRRLEIGYSPEGRGEAAEKASRLMAELMNWDEKVRQAELDRYYGKLFP